MNGVFEIQVRLSDAWQAVGRLYLARPVNGRMMSRICSVLSPLAQGFACDGRVEFGDGGVGPRAFDWLQAGAHTYALTDGGIQRLSVDAASAGAFLRHPSDVKQWGADEFGLSTLDSLNTLRVFGSDGGYFAIQFPDDSPLAAVWRQSGVTFFSRDSADSVGEVCEVRASAEVQCSAGFISAVAKDNAWGLASTFSNEFVWNHFQFDGGWRGGAVPFVSPSGWFPLGSGSRAVPEGVALKSPDQRRVLVWTASETHGGYELVLLNAPSSVLASGVQQGLFWASWDGGIFLGR
ncbi:MAG: hypothetical protein SFW67_08720 [Myxococcaceae bacterium]|nr:hypothetical protein [Myxococcaceae bacterium]